jgi:hypothetical protein
MWTQWISLSHYLFNISKFKFINFPRADVKIVLFFTTPSTILTTTLCSRKQKLFSFAFSLTHAHLKLSAKQKVKIIPLLYIKIFNVLDSFESRRQSSSGPQAWETSLETNSTVAIPKNDYLEPFSYNLYNSAFV